MLRIMQSVGKGGKNLCKDVMLVQALLNRYNMSGVIAPLKIDGKMGKRSSERIEKFQKKVVGMFKPDGRIDPNKKTFNKLVSRPFADYPYTYNLSNKGIELLKSIEELATKPYDDQTGKEISSWVSGATIGYGHLIKKAEWVKYKNGITKQKAHSLFKSDLVPFEDKVRLSVKVKLLQNEFDALVILAFNIGNAAFASSSVLKLVNDPSASTVYSGLERAWKAWNKSQGKHMKGLSNRRQAEWNIYSKNTYRRW